MSQRRQQQIDSLESYLIGQINKHKMNTELKISSDCYTMEDIEFDLGLIAEYTTKLRVLKEYFNV